MASNRLEVFQQNTKNIACVICSVDNIDGSFGDYNPWLTVKKKAPSNEVVLSNLGTIDSSTTAVFNLTPTDTSLAAMDYVYDITLIHDSIDRRYTVVKDRFSVLDGVKF